MLLKLHASPYMLCLSLCNKKRLAIQHMNRPLFPTTLSIPSYDIRKLVGLRTYQHPHVQLYLCVFFYAGISFVTLLQLENDLEFLGLLIMQNALKPETAPTIEQLQVAQVRCVMVTGQSLPSCNQITQRVAYKFRDFRFLQQWIWGLMFSGMWHHTVLREVLKSCGGTCCVHLQSRRVNRTVFLSCRWRQQVRLTPWYYILDYMVSFSRNKWFSVQKLFYIWLSHLLVGNLKCRFSHSNHSCTIFG